MKLRVPSVVHVSSVHSWNDNRIYYRECASLAESGYKVTLVAVESDVNEPSSNVKVITIPRMHRLKRATYGTLLAIRHALQVKPDVIHLHDPELVWSVPVLRLMRKRVIYDAHEDLPAQVKSKGYIPAPIRKFAELLSYVIVKIAGLSTAVVATTETVAKRFPAVKTYIVHNYPWLRSAESVAQPVLEREQSVVYIGAIDEVRGALTMVRAAEHLPSGWTLQLAGPLNDSLRESLSRENGWKRTVYHGVLSPYDARELLLSCRIGLVTLKDTPAYRDSLPTKLFEYFAAGLPSIASDFPLWREITRSAECATFVHQDSHHDIAEAVSNYSEDEEVLQLHSRNARHLAETQLNWKSEATVLLDLYGRVLHHEFRTFEQEQD